MDIKALVDLAIDEDTRSPCLWIPTEYWPTFCEAIRQRPNLIGAVIYRNKTIRDGGLYSDITTPPLTPNSRSAIQLEFCVSCLGFACLALPLSNL